MLIRSGRRNSFLGDLSKGLQDVDDQIHVGKRESL